MKRLMLLAGCLSLFLSGCALSPQTVVINPDLNIASPASTANDIRLALVVEDPRPSKVIGQRGGVYKTTSDISTDANMTATLRRKLANELSKLGYQVVPGDDAAKARLLVEIVDLKYIAHEEKLLNTIETKVAVRATCRKGSEQYSSTYRVTNKKEVVKAPSEQGNQELVNNVIATALGKMLTDEELIAFIDG